MSTHDDDILDFDFFEEGATREDAPTREGRGGDRRPTRGGSGPRRPHLRGTGLTPLLRLVGLIAFAILIVVAVGVLNAASWLWLGRETAWLREYLRGRPQEAGPEEPVEGKKGERRRAKRR